MAVFQCKSHKDCQFMARGQRVANGCYEVQITPEIVHNERSGAIRAGCDISQEDKKLILKMLDNGSTPARIYSALTREEEARCKLLRVIPVKRPEGGLEGACSSHCLLLLGLYEQEDPRIHAKYTLNTCKIHGTNCARNTRIYFGFFNKTNLFQHVPFTNPSKCH